RIGSEEREVRVLGAAVTGDRVRTAHRELAGRVVQTSAEVRASAGDAAILVAGRKIRKQRDGQVRGSRRRAEAELRGQVKRSRSTVGEWPLVVEAVDEPVAIASVASDAVKRERSRYFPVV